MVDRVMFGIDFGFKWVCLIINCFYVCVLCDRRALLEGIIRLDWS